MRLKSVHFLPHSVSLQKGVRFHILDMNIHIRCVQRRVLTHFVIFKFGFQIDAKRQQFTKNRGGESNIKNCTLQM